MKVFKKLFDFLHWFWTSYLGQRLLLLIAPFLLLNPFERKTSHPLLLERILLGYFAPGVGWVFMIGAFFSFLHFLDNYGLHLDWVLPLSTTTAQIRLFLLGASLAYIIPFSWYGAARILKVFHTTTLKDMCTYYGGVYMLWGIVMWAVVVWGMVAMNWFAAFLTLGILVGLSIFAFIELKHRQRDGISGLSLKERHKLRLYQSVIFFSLLGLTLFLLSLV